MNRNLTDRIILNAIKLLLLGCIAGACVALAHQAAAPPAAPAPPSAPSKYVPSHEQLLQLQLDRANATIAQQALVATPQWAAFDHARSVLQADADQVKAANKWPPSVVFNPDTVTFDEPVGKPEAPSPSSPSRK
jgi:hypothetical protein